MPDGSITVSQVIVTSPEGETETQFTLGAGRLLKAVFPIPKIIRTKTI